MIKIDPQLMADENPLELKPTIILFDMDGTLVDNSDVVADAYYYGMIELGYEPISRGEIRKLFGRSTYETGRGMGIEEEDLVKIDKYFWDYFGRYAETLEGKPQVYNSVNEILELLDSFNIRMGICTSNESKSARILMDKAGLGNYFSVYIGSEDLKERKPSPEPLLLALRNLEFDYSKSTNLRREVWFVGDTKYDVEAAHNANLLAIGITQDSTADLMLSAEPDIVVDSISDLYSSIQNAWNI
ncbi:MAG: HAD family hydrolase [Candidatus Heimdallarchaeota archaeon]|nr:HAD family hydrolase [Candidatus Heimdallarchaeota archaeon]